MLAWCYMRSSDDKINNYSTRQQTLDKITGYLKYAISLEPDIPDHYNAMAQYYGYNNNLDLAIDYLKKALALTTDKSDKLLYLDDIGNAYLGLNDFVSAKNYLDEALSIDPNNSYTLFILGMVQGNASEVIKYFEKVNPQKFENAIKGKYYSMYALALKDTGNFQKSKEMVLKALELDPSNVSLQLLYEQVK